MGMRSPKKMTSSGQQEEVSLCKSVLGGDYNGFHQFFKGQLSTSTPIKNGDQAAGLHFLWGITFYLATVAAISNPRVRVVGLKTIQAVNKARELGIITF
jgi:hypothetical protein